jgi:tetratricopeptide (TPR) repeat protein
MVRERRARPGRAGAQDQQRASRPAQAPRRQPRPGARPRPRQPPRPGEGPATAASGQRRSHAGNAPLSPHTDQRAGARRPCCADGGRAAWLAGLWLLATAPGAAGAQAAPASLPGPPSSADESAAPPQAPIPPAGPLLATSPAPDATPASAAELFHRARALQQQGRPAEARPLARQALQRDPTYQDAAYLLGLLAYLAHDDAEAQAAFGEAVRLDPGSPLGRSASGYLRRLAQEQEARSALAQGLQRFRDGDHAAALPLLHRAEAELPGSPLVRYYLGYTWLRLGDPARAREALLQAARLDPADGWTQLLLAVCDLRTGRTAPARVVLAELRQRYAGQELGERAADYLARLPAGPTSPRPWWRLDLGLLGDSNPQLLTNGVPLEAAQPAGVGWGLGLAGGITPLSRRDSTPGHELQLAAALGWRNYPGLEPGVDPLAARVGLQHGWRVTPRLELHQRLEGAVRWSDYRLEHDLALLQLGAELGLAEWSRTSLTCGLYRRGGHQPAAGSPDGHGLGLGLLQTLGPWGGDRLRLEVRLGYQLQVETAEAITTTASWSLPPEEEDEPPLTGATRFTQDPSFAGHGPQLAVHLHLPGQVQLQLWSHLQQSRHARPWTVVWSWAEGEERWSATPTQQRLRYGGHLRRDLGERLSLVLGAEGEESRADLSRAAGDPFDLDYSRLAGWLLLQVHAPGGGCGGCWSLAL